MDLHSIKKRLQSHMSDGLVTIVGSGLSCAEGLPGMDELARYLCAELTDKFVGDDATMWETASALIATQGLEAALLKVAPTPTVEEAIAATAGKLIAERERAVVTEVFTGTRTLRLTRLLAHILKPTAGLPIITTNYDRLVEIAAEEAGIGADTMFFGRFAGKLNDKESLMSFCRDVKLRSGHRSVELVYCQRALICKPHGSLDWYSRNGSPVFYAGDLPEATRLIITPGHNKFRNGYDSPFHQHLARANQAIDNANRFLVLGYGFNDDHLQTNLMPKIKGSKPALIMTHTLSDEVRQLALAHTNIIALEHTGKPNDSGTTVIIDQREHVLSGIDIWDVNSFVSEVLEP